VRILALALADEAQRFVRGYPPKGARLLLRPNIEVCRLAALAGTDDRFDYLDERVDVLEVDSAADLVLCYVGLGHDPSAREVALHHPDLPVVFFGPGATRWSTRPEWARHRVCGDITGIWPNLARDARTRSIRTLYASSGPPRYTVPRQALGCNPEMTGDYRSINFIQGCSCPEPVRGFCTSSLYYGDQVSQRTPEEIVGEVITIPNKHIHLLDEDVARFPEYYRDLFRSLWNYRRHWTVNASERLFDYPDLVRVMAKAGTRIVFLDDSFLIDRLMPATRDNQIVRWLYRRVKSLQAARMLVGARVTIRLRPDTDYDAIAGVLRRIDLDFIETRFIQQGPGRDELVSVSYRPMVQKHEPGHVKNRFFAMDSILDRLFRRPRRVGFYTTAMFLLPYSMAYRQNFLEGLPDL
jgi:hypothetical protein